VGVSIGVTVGGTKVLAGSVVLGCVGRIGAVGEGVDADLAFDSPTIFSKLLFDPDEVDSLGCSMPISIVPQAVRNIVRMEERVKVARLIFIVTTPVSRWLSCLFSSQARPQDHNGAMLQGYIGRVSKVKHRVSDLKHWYTGIVFRGNYFVGSRSVKTVPWPARLRIVA
jgi:hypothetical protein